MDESLYGPLVHYVRSASFDWADAQKVTPKPSWGRTLHPLGYPVTLATDEHGTIYRAALRRLAARSLSEQTEQSVLELFWNILVWGSGDDRRRIPRITAAIAVDRPAIANALLKAQQHAFEGQVGDGFRTLSRLIPYWGPAFFTKFLAFSSDTSDPAKPQPLILDDRVRTAWRALSGGTFPGELRSADHVRYCATVADIAVATSVSPEEVEIVLFLLGGKVGSYTKWLESELAVIRRVTGRAATVDEIIAEIG